MVKHKLCTNKLCAHEWDGEENKCSWCGSPGKTIAILRPWSMQAMLSLVKKMRLEREGGETSERN